MLVVGFLLNFINQVEALFYLNLVNINWFKFFLAFLVPYLVATYSVAVAQMQFRKGTVSSVEIGLECKSCHEKIHVKKMK